MKRCFDALRQLAKKNQAAESVLEEVEGWLEGPYSVWLWNWRKLELRKRYRRNTGEQLGLTPEIYRAEYEKYAREYRANPKGWDLYLQMTEFLSCPLELAADHLTLSPDPCVPTVVVVVKDELDRMKLFYQHHRALGLHQFIVLDNDSTDGTREWLAQQPDTRVYRVTSPFQTQKKESWIEKVLAMTGYDRWYMVLDSDELLDYIGSESISAETLVRRLHAAGYRRAWGYMLDMYSSRPMMTVECAYQDIPKEFCYFDKNTYFLTAEYQERCDRKVDMIVGGPRFRLFGTKQVMSKQAIFFYEKDTLYRNCHFVQPLIHWGTVPCCFVLRHYKYLKQDRVSYQKRVQNASFASNSVEYIRQLDSIAQNQEQTMMYPESERYADSRSLCGLPYLNSPEFE